MDNKFRIEPEKGNQTRVKPKAKSGSFFSGIEKKLQLESYLEEGFPVQYLPKIFFVMLLGIIYIGNTHSADRTVRAINKMQSEVEDMRAEYTTLKAEVMFASKQSEVARRAKDLGLRESLKPPFKIVVDKSEY
jgi:hypothetical protein